MQPDDDPYARAPYNNMNEKMLTTILDGKIRSEKDFEEIVPMLSALIDNVAKVPNIDPSVVKSLHQDMKDIIALSNCKGTKRIVLRWMTQMIFEIRSLFWYQKK